MRSSLLADILTDPALAPTREVVLEVLPFIPEEDLEVFLLYSLSRHPESLADLQRAVTPLKLRWQGAGGVGRVMLWWGVKEYLNENRQVFGEYTSAIPGINSLMFLLPDLAGASSEDILENLLQSCGVLNPAFAPTMRALRERLTPSERAFGPLRLWLQDLTVEAEPRETQEWESLAELTFWAGYLGTQPATSITLFDVPIEELPIETVGRICLALERSDRQNLLEALSQHEEALKRRFQEETATPLLSESDGEITAHFIVPANFLLPDSFDQKERLTNGPPTLQEQHATLVLPGALGTKQGSARSDSVKLEKENGSQGAERTEASQPSLSSKLNEEAVWRASLLRALFPNRGRFCTQGYGHRLSIEGLELPHDDTNKAMEGRALHVPWLTAVNALSNNLWVFQGRPESWREYAIIVLRKRDLIATALLKLRRSLSAYFERSSPRSLLSGSLTEEVWKEARLAATNAPNLPKSALDEWGLSSETQASAVSTESRVSRSVASIASLLAQRPLARSMQEYSSAIENFFVQAEVIAVTHGFIGRQPGRRAEIRAVADRAGYNEANIRLSKFNLFTAMQRLGEMQEVYDERVGFMVESGKLEQVKRRETQLFPELWTLWYQFCHHPEKRYVSAPAQSLGELERARDDLRQALVDGIAEGPEWRCRMLRSDYSWERKSSLVLELAVDRLEVLEEAKGALYRSLEGTFGGQEIGGLAAYALDFYWANVLVIPTTAGRVLGGAWVLPAASLALSSNESLIERGHLKILHALSSEQAAELGLEPAEPGWIPGLAELEATAGQLQLIFGHLSDFRELVPQLDSEGEAVFSAYFSELSPRVSELITRCRRLLAEVERKLQAATSLDPGLRDEAVSLLANATAAFDEVLVEGQAMGFEDYGRLKNELEELSGSFLVLGWMTTYGNR